MIWRFAIGLLGLAVVGADLVPRAFAADAPGLPKEMFGIELGGVYVTGCGQGQPNEIPVKRCTGIERSGGRGLSYYFEPLNAHPVYYYYEKKKSADDLFYPSTFRLYIFPIVPDKSAISAIQDTPWNAVEYEVALIEWSDVIVDKDEGKREGYNWALDMCKTFKVYFEVQPRLVDSYEYSAYKCTFEQEDRELLIDGSTGYRLISLSYDASTMQKKNDHLDALYRKLMAKDLLSPK